MFFLFFSLLHMLLTINLLSSMFDSKVLCLTLFSMSGMGISFKFLFDYVSLGFFSAVSFISSMVFFYSKFYMEGTVNSRRFNWLVFGFVMSMALLVFSGNLLTLMIGWDGLGLISFCLVIFYSNYSSLESGLVTVFSNRVGDIFFLGCFLAYFLSGEGVSNEWHHLHYLIFSFLFLGAITKSAQFPFSAWLPAAMAAPTPVSSLVHSSTLVTAGVYVLTRFHYLFSFQNVYFMKTFFLLTTMLAGVCACVEKDFKKIVAMSTLSQLGLMLFTLTTSYWLLTYMHMIIHAFFKSLLFMNTGSLMHDLTGGQDSRLFGGNSYSFGCFLCFLASSLCLMGFPFFIGFYSKDLIITSSSLSLGSTLYLMFLLGCLLTVYYSFRLLYGSFMSLMTSMTHNSNSDNKIFLFSVYFLLIMCSTLGSIFMPLFFFDSNVNFLATDLIIGLLLIATVLSMYNFFSCGHKLLASIYTIGYLKWMTSSSSSLSTSSYHKWDNSWLELSGGQGTYKLLMSANYLDYYKSLSLGLIILLVIFLILLLS